LGLEHPKVASSLNNLALLYRNQGRYTEAEALYKRALAIAKKVFGFDHPKLSIYQNNLALLYKNQSRYAEAELLYKRNLEIDKKLLGFEHPKVAISLNNLASLYSDLERYDEAELLYKQALEISKKALGINHLEIATYFNNLAFLYSEQGLYEEAEQLYKRSLAIFTKLLAYKHPYLAQTLHNLAIIYKRQHKTSQALDAARRAASIYRTRYMKLGSEYSIGKISEQKGYRDLYILHISLLEETKIEKAIDVSRVEEGFGIAQLASASSTGQAISRMAVRFASGNNELAKLVRKKQDALVYWQSLDKSLIRAASELPDARDLEHETELREVLISSGKKIKAIDNELTQHFPKYQELTSSEPLTIETAQKLLGKNEALISYLVGEEESYFWVVSKDKVAMHTVNLTSETLTKIVQLIRQSLDQVDIETVKDIQPFAVSEAHKLYQVLFSQVEPLLKGIKHLIVVPDGPLQSLPFGVLVTESYEKELKDLKSHKDVAWLAKQYAITVLPSVSSLRALRRFAKKSVGESPFVGFGDPVLGGDDGKRSINFSALFARGAIANVDEVRKLPSIPDTADELNTLAKILKSDINSIYLKQQATETKVKTTDLTPYQTVAFATHGLMAGQLKGVAEPALVFTPPKKGTVDDDGLLTASEVAQLKLNADWVLLSACNTASSDGTPGAEGLSGLAKAFFYAGTRSLLVSHWNVESDATVQLITNMLNKYENHPAVGKSEALRHSMMTLMNNDEKPHYAHPIFWAPFVVVGEGMKR